jgi:hypothetical protein
VILEGIKSIHTECPHKICVIAHKLVILKVTVPSIFCTFHLKITEFQIPKFITEKCSLKEENFSNSFSCWGCFFMSTTQHQVHEGPCHGLKLVVINFLHDDLLDTQRAFVPLFSSHNNQQPRRTRRAQQIHPMHNLSAYLFFLSSAMQILPLLYSWDFATL